MADDFKNKNNFISSLMGSISGTMEISNFQQLIIISIEHYFDRRKAHGSSFFIKDSNDFSISIFRLNKT